MHLGVVVRVARRFLSEQLDSALHFALINVLLCVHSLPGCSGRRVVTAARCDAERRRFSDQHAEHRVIAGSLVLDNKGLMHLADGVLLIHTDLASVRHVPIRLFPGAWSITVEREIGDIRGGRLCRGMIATAAAVSIGRRSGGPQ